MNLNQITHAQDAIQRTINQNGSLDQKISAIKSIILELLTTRTEYFFGLQNGITLAQLAKQYSGHLAWYKSKLTTWENGSDGSSNPAWVQIRCSEHIEMKAIDTGLRYKVYRTIPLQDYSFIQFLGSLQQALRNLGSNTHDSISFKVPGGLLGFLKHPDSLVVHFRKQENLEVINQIIHDWMTQNQIHHGKRNLDRTEFAVDHSGMSFSELIAANFAYQIVYNPLSLKLLLGQAVEIAQKPNIGS